MPRKSIPINNDEIVLSNFFDELRRQAIRITNPEIVNLWLLEKVNRSRRLAMRHNSKNISLKTLGFWAKMFDREVNGERGWD